MQLRNILRTAGRDKSSRLTSRLNSVPTARRSRRCSTKLVLRLGESTTAATRPLAPTPALRSFLLSVLFNAIYVGNREIRRFDYHALFARIMCWQSSNNDGLVARSGFEPLISALRGLHPRPLDERAGE